MLADSGIPQDPVLPASSELVWTIMSMVLLVVVLVVIAVLVRSILGALWRQRAVADEVAALRSRVAELEQLNHNP